ncbi:MAG: ABC transporter substrate-binding protein [Proteobacteria bacterium]|nr:ABC transporter substrate-binding protein [Pseudomonadota bacterium]
MPSQIRPTTRRGFMRGAALTGSALAAPFIWTGRSFGADQITVADVGGAPAAAIKTAFYDPFIKETGINVVGVVHDSDPTVQFKLLVDTKSYIWDLCMVTPAHVGLLTRTKNYIEPLGIAPEEGKDLVPGTLTDNWVGFSVYSIIRAYRTNTFGDNIPATWADFWNVEKYPGRRGLYRGLGGMIEGALLADGVPQKDLYPLDVKRALASLTKVKKHINVWWTSGAQNTQLLQSGEIDLIDTWGARAYAAISSGAPVKMIWDQGFYNTDGWSIPAGSPRANLARKFARFCMKPEQQAIYSNIVANGPTNKLAYQGVKPERAAILPTSPENLAKLMPINDLWWTMNKPKVLEQFEDWLIAG